MFVNELASAVAFIEGFPNAGESVEHRRIQNLRRVLLSGVQYHLYYSADLDGGVIELLALWHTSRAGRPPL
jgi:hypothetical protein